MDSTIKALHKNIAEWMAGPTGAVLIHLLLLLAILFLVDFSSGPDVPEPVEVTYLDLVPQTLDPDPPTIDLTIDLDTTVPVVEPPQIEADLPPAPESMDFNQPIAMETPKLEIPDVPAVTIIRNLTAGSLQGRLGGHEQAGKRYGGEAWKYAEVAVKRALECLRVNQNPDGSWGTNDKEAMAGLAILTYLAHGETTSSAEFGPTVERAIRYLVGRQNDAGEFAKTDTTAGTYSQAICVYALSEAYGMTRIPSLKPAMEKGAEVIIQGQQSGGGFDYRFEKGARRDTSLGGWCSQALKAAYIAGAGNPGLKRSMDLAVADLKSVQQEDGSFLYTDRNSHATHSMTAVAVLGMQLLGHDRDAEVRKGLNYLEDARCDWKNPPAWPMYAWYYISQSKFHQGGGEWTSWNNKFAPQFIRNQNPDGSWNSAGLSLKAGTTGRENMHPVYATTLAALTLQVYYRFLPTYQPIGEQAVQPEISNEVEIQIL